MDDRNTSIVLGGEEYNLLLTTKALRDISAKYGGMDNLQKAIDELTSSGNTAEMFDQISWLICALVNGAIERENYIDKTNRLLLTVEQFEILSDPVDFAVYKSAAMTAMVKGVKRNIMSEDDGKNTVGE